MNIEEQKTVMNHCSAYTIPLLDSENYLEALRNTGTVFSTDPHVSLKLLGIILLLSGSNGRNIEIANYIHEKGEPGLASIVYNYTRDVGGDAYATFSSDVMRYADTHDSICAEILTAFAFSSLWDSGDVNLALAGTYIDKLLNRGFTSVLICYSECPRLLGLLFAAFWNTCYGIFGTYLKEALENDKYKISPDKKETLLSIVKPNTINTDLFIQVAKKLFVFDQIQNQFDNEGRMYILLMEHRLEAAEILAKKNAIFLPVFETLKFSVESIKGSQDFNGEIFPRLKQDMDFIYEFSERSSEIANDLYFKLILLAHGSFLFQGSADYWRGLLDEVYAASAYDIKGIAFLALTVVILWFVDYDNFRKKLDEA